MFDYCYDICWMKGFIGEVNAAWSNVLIKQKHSDTYSCQPTSPGRKTLMTVCSHPC